MASDRHDAVVGVARYLTGYHLYNGLYIVGLGAYVLL